MTQATLVGHKVGAYEILSLLGSGGMAEAYLARKKGTEGFSRLVVLKVLLPERASDPKFIQMFIDEACLSNLIEHSNVVRIEDFIKINDRYASVLEYVPGVSLVEMMDGLHGLGRVMAAPLAVSIVLQVLEGLEASHNATDALGRALRVVHRDVSPPNVLLSLAGNVKLIDFGIAKARTQQVKTAMGTIKGKLRYMAPEQFTGDPIGPWTDLYALSIILWELLTMKPLFGDRTKTNLKETLVREVTAPSQLCADIPVALDRVVLRGLAVEPSVRFRTAAEFSKALLSAVPESKDVSSAVVGEFVRAVLPEATERVTELLEGDVLIAGPTEGQLVVLNGPNADEVFTIDDVKDSWIAGRAVECDFTLNDGDASRQHFEIARDRHGLCLTDLGSKNGLLINGERVTRHWLEVGDELRAGDTLLRFEAIGGSNDGGATVLGRNRLSTLTHSSRPNGSS